MNEKYKIREDYQIEAKDEFDAISESVKMDGETIEYINRYVGEKTHGQINDMVDESLINDSTKLAAINALYFNSVWGNGVWDDCLIDFNYTVSNEIKKVSAMSNNFNIKTYFEDSGFEGFTCGYMLDDIVFVGFMPKDNSDFELTGNEIRSVANKIKDIYSNLKNDEEFFFDAFCTVYMPQITAEQETDLVDILQSTGFTLPFNSISANFTKIYEGNKTNASIDVLKQKSKIDINNVGTTASAVTISSVTFGDILEDYEPPKPDKVLIFDHPYAFMIYDTASDQILFIGKVVDPKHE